MVSYKKIIISGLDNAGKTSILTAFNKRYNFEEEINQLLPTRKVVYHKTEFLNNVITFWDMGGQEMYRKEYQLRPDMYFPDTNLIIYIIDIQDSERFETSMDYLMDIMQYFEKNNMKVPLIVVFHKFDPKLMNSKELIDNANKLTVKLMDLEQLQMIFLQSSIYNVYSIVELMSAALALFNINQLEIKKKLEVFLTELECHSLILFNKNGIIVSEDYSDSIDLDLYKKIIGSINKHIVQLKEKQEENSEVQSQFFEMDDPYLSYLDQITIKNELFYISSILKNTNKSMFIKKFPKFKKFLIKSIKSLLK